MIKLCEKGSAFFERAQSVEPHGVEPFEYIAILAVVRSVAVFLDKALNLLKARDDALLPGRTAALLFRLREIVELRTQFI